MITILAASGVGFFIGYALRHSIGYDREVGAWHEGYMWGIRHTLEEFQKLDGLADAAREALRKFVEQKGNAPWN